MDIKSKLNSLIIITAIVFFLSISKVHASSANVVYSVTGNPLITTESIKVSTITKGYTAANSAVYKPVVQTIGKSLFLSVFRKAVGVTPIGIGLILAYDYYYNDDGDLVSKQSLTLEQLHTEDFDNKIGKWWFAGGYSSKTWPQARAEYQAYLNGALGDMPNFTITYDNGVLTMVDGSTKFQINLDSEPGGEALVSDEQLLNSFEDYALNNDVSDIFNNADGSVNQDYFPNPDFSLNTVEDDVLLDLYKSGLLQSTDPLLDNYVTPEELARIEKLYATQNPTDAELAESLTDAMEQPITQEQYANEQALKEAREDALLIETATGLKGLTDSVNASDEYTTTVDDGWDKMHELLNTTNDLPDTSGLINYFQFNSSSGCETIQLPFNVIFPSPAQCEKLGTLKELFGYFLFVLVGWNIITTVLKEAN